MQELRLLFERQTSRQLTNHLDRLLLDSFNPVQNDYVSEALQYLHLPGHDLLIDEIAERKLGISRKQLNRLFRQYLGTSPQKYRSIVRFRQLMDYKLRREDQQSYTSLSHQAHYTDQSHFIKACRQLTGLTPSQFFKDGKRIGSEDIFWKFKG